MFGKNKGAFESNDKRIAELEKQIAELKEQLNDSKVELDSVNNSTHLVYGKACIFRMVLRRLSILTSSEECLDIRGLNYPMT